MTYMKKVGALLLLASAVFSQTAVADGDAENGATIGSSCLGCHGIDGYRNAYPSYRVPKIGGQKRGYIVNALTAYRNGARKHPTMNAQGASLSDQDITDIAAWLESLGQVQDDATAESVAGIDAAQACVACHGASGAAVVPPPPTLGGQHRDYLRHALEQYRSGARNGGAMNAFAAGLSDEDIEQVTLFYSSQKGLQTLKRAQ